MSEKFKAGQEVRFIPYGSKGHVSYTVTITKVARKYVHAIVHGRPCTFDKQTGYQPGDFAGRIVTEEMLASEDARKSALARVEDLRRGYGNAWGRLTNDQIDRIADIYEEPTA